MSKLLVSFNKFQTMDDTISPTKLPVGHLPYIVNYTYDELFALKKIGGNTEASFGSYVASAPEEATMVDAYWDDGSVYNTSVLKETFALKWPSAAASIPTTTPVYMQISLTTTATGGGYVGKMYRATTTWTEATTTAPTPSTDYIDINCPSNNTQYTFNIPMSWYLAWYDGDYDTNFGVVVIGTGGTFHSSSGVLGYGTGADGNIVISADTNINTVYATVAGGTYAPQDDIVINAYNFTINPGVTVTCNAYADGTNKKTGAIVIKCQGTFTNNGTINVSGLGWTSNAGGPGGGANGYDTGNAGTGGSGAGFAGPGTAGTGNYGPGATYGTKELPSTTQAEWELLYGSGGGYGGTYAGGGAGSSGDGGGVVRIYAETIDNTNGTITSNGTNGGYGNDLHSGGGGAGSGGSIRLEATTNCYLGSNITALGASGGGGYNTGGSSSVGRIYVAAQIVTGTTTPNYETNS